MGMKAHQQVQRNCLSLSPHIVPNASIQQSAKEEGEKSSNHKAC